MTAITNSRLCKINCIDAKKNFCPSLDKKTGFCCDNSENCPRSDVCSNDIATSTDLKYWACNYNSSCTSTGYQVIPAFGISKTITLAPISGSGVLLDNLCNWVIKHSAEAFNNDTLSIKVNTLTRAKIFYMIGETYTQVNVTTGTLVAG